MPTFCRKPEVASFYSSLKQPYTKMCHRTTNRHTDEIIYVRFRRYVCISFANFLLCKKYIAQLNKSPDNEFLKHKCLASAFIYCQIFIKIGHQM